MSIARKPPTAPAPPPEVSASIRSPWVWRGFLFMSLIAFGLGLTFATGRQGLYAGAWAFIALGWFAISMWLWRRHAQYDDAIWRFNQQTTRPGVSGALRGR